MESIETNPVSYRRLLSKNPEFRSLWLGQAISQFGDALYYLFFYYLVDKLTKDPMQVGYVVAIQGLPYLLFSAYAGALADRLDRKLLMLISDLGSALLLFIFSGFLLWGYQPQMVWILALAGSLATLNVFFAPAKGAVIPRIVQEEDLGLANSLSSATQNLMPLIGVGLSGLVISILAHFASEKLFGLVAGLNAATFLVSAAFVSKIRSVRAEREIHEDHYIWRESIEGLKFVNRMPVIRAIVGLSIALNFFISPFMLVYVSVNREWFGGNYWTLAMFECAFFLPMMGMAIYIGKKNFGRPGLCLIWGIGIAGFFVLLMGISKAFWPFLLLNFLCGIVVPFSNIPVQTYLQKSVPDAFMGRVQALMSMAVMVTMPLGNLVAGPLLAKFGPAFLFFYMGGGLALAGMLGLFSRPLVGARMPETKVD
jgi:MFS family permease